MTGEELKKELFYQKKNGLLTVSEDVEKKAEEYCKGYVSFLDEGKTEREAAAEAVRLLKEKDFVPFDVEATYHPGDRVFVNNRGKAVIAAVIGTLPLEEGLRIAAAHIDSPRLDLKPNPLYEQDEIALFKTHYYGGIKKYQWTAIPLSLHGVVVKRDGSKVTIRIGDDAGDPIFCVTDLLPHLATEQSKRTLSDGIRGEELNILVGSCPFKDDEVSEKVKLNILKLLNEKYGIVEEDFLSAELEAVPAFMAKDLGFDRSMIGAYGHDDRVCGYAALAAVLSATTPKHTTVMILADKEEIGSDGTTGLSSNFLEYFIKDLAENMDARFTTVCRNSQCLSADVNAAYDPTFPDVMEKNNSAFLNYGVVVTKYTGARGKSGTSDAPAEFAGRVTKLLSENGVIWQTGELGKVDMGGGGTVAMFVANLNIDTIDLGVPVLSMHAPFEVIAKLDAYMTYRAMECFYND